MQRVFNLADPNNNYWKEKFITGLPGLFSERVKDTIEQKYGRISYNELTYGDLITCVNINGLKLCQDQRLSIKLKKESAQTRKELGHWCEQFGFGRLKPPHKKKQNYSPYHKNSTYRRKHRKTNKKYTGEPPEYYKNSKKKHNNKYHNKK